MSRQLFEYHPVIGYRFIPNLKARVNHESGGYLVQINNLGFRSNTDFVPQKRNGIRRVLLFGDSFTAGDGVSNKKRYSDLLEQKIPNLEVYNFGLSGTGTDQQYLVYKEYATGIEHDVLIIAMLVENIRRVASHYRCYHNEKGEQVYYAKPYYELVNGELVLKNVPPRKEPIAKSDLPKEERGTIDQGGRFLTIRKLITKVGLKDIAQKVTSYQPVPDYDSPDNPTWQVMCAILKEWIDNHPKPILLMPIPLYQHVEETSDPSQYQARFSEIAEITNCIIHDPCPELLKYPQEVRRRFRFKKDIHPTTEGHAALATSLAPIVEQLLDDPK